MRVAVGRDIMPCLASVLLLHQFSVGKRNVTEDLDNILYGMRKDHPPSLPYPSRISPLVNQKNGPEGCKFSSSEADSCESYAGIWADSEQR